MRQGAATTYVCSVRQVVSVRRVIPPTPSWRPALNPEPKPYHMHP